METYAAERGVNLQLRFEAINNQLPNYQPPDYQVLADGKALQQALVNLIDNALKHSPKGNTVTVAWKRGQGRQKSQTTVANAPNTPPPSSSGSKTTAKASHPPSTRRSSSASTAAAPSCGARPRVWGSA